MKIYHNYQRVKITGLNMNDDTLSKKELNTKTHKSLSNTGKTFKLGKRQR